MITVSECAAFAGLASNELVLGAVPSAKHRRLLSSYLLNLKRGPEAVRDLMVADLRGLLDLGVTSRAADLLIVLRLFLSDYPQARLACADDQKIFAGEVRGARRASNDARLTAFRQTVDDRGEGVVISLRRMGRGGRSAARNTPSIATPRENTPIVARLGSRLSCFRSDR